MKLTILILLIGAIGHTALAGNDMAQYFGNQKKPKPGTPGASTNPAMADTKGMPSMDPIPGLTDRKSAPAKSADPPKKDTASPPAKGMGVGKPLLSKSFTDGGDKFKITVTKEK